MRSLIAVLFLLLSAPAIATPYFFSSSFTECGTGGWSGAGGSASYDTTGCQDSACCGKQSFTAGENNVSAFWYKIINNVQASTVRAKGWWKFPTNWQWVSLFGNWKAMFLETSTAINRMFINFNTHDSTRAEICALVEGPNATYKCVDSVNGPFMTSDGLWHSVEVLWTRAVGVDAGHVKIWVDGVLHLDVPITTCNGSCPTLSEYKFGGYQNWSSPQIQSFHVDNTFVEFDESGFCGDGNVNGSEQCEGSNMNGATCTSLGFTGGTLSCSGTCAYDTSACTSPPTTPQSELSGLTMRGVTLR